MKLKTAFFIMLVSCCLVTGTRYLVLYVAMQKDLIYAILGTRVFGRKSVSKQVIADAHLLLAVLFVCSSSLFAH